MEMCQQKLITETSDVTKTSMLTRKRRWHQFWRNKNVCLWHNIKMTKGKQFWVKYGSSTRTSHSSAIIIKNKIKKRHPFKLITGLLLSQLESTISNINSSTIQKWQNFCFWQFVFDNFKINGDNCCTWTDGDNWITMTHWTLLEYHTILDLTDFYQGKNNKQASDDKRWEKNERKKKHWPEVAVLWWWVVWKFSSGRRLHVGLNEPLGEET